MFFNFYSSLDTILVIFLQKLLLTAAILLCAVQNHRITLNTSLIINASRTAQLDNISLNKCFGCRVAEQFTLAEQVVFVVT